MIARMVLQITMVVVMLALAIHMLAKRNHEQAPQVAAVTNIAQPAKQVPVMVAVQPAPAAAIVAQVKTSPKVITKNDATADKAAVLVPGKPGTLEVANLPGTGEVVR